MLSFSITFLITFINISILFFVVKKFLWKPVTAIIEERKKKIEKEIESAKRDQDKAKKILADYDEMMANATHEAYELKNSILNDAKAEALSIVQDAKKESEKLFAKAYAEIEREKSIVQKELEVYVASLAMVCAEKLINKDMDTVGNRVFIESLLKKGIAQ